MIIKYSSVDMNTCEYSPDDSIDAPENRADQEIREMILKRRLALLCSNGMESFEDD